MSKRSPFSNGSRHMPVCIPVQKSILLLQDEGLAGESDSQEVDDDEDDAGRHEIREIRNLRAVDRWAEVQRCFGRILKSTKSSDFQFIRTLNLSLRYTRAYAVVW